ncbi:MAG: carboxypeptidase-like regulatory domain-containing protein [Marinilabiliaceae bacterium]|nr:carboxypeptidase-like regulatory domain-containing protein [Marinilabiliaceae bacterium]
MKRLFIILTFFYTVLNAYSQYGILTGKITDGKTGEELVGATVVIEGTTTGSVTNFMGEYSLPELTPGTYTIICQFISYEPQTKTGVIISSGKNTTVDFKMLPAELNLEEVHVVAKANMQSENMLLMEMKESVIFSESIGAQQLSSQGVSDAASAATKMTGINKQSSSNVLFIRGLGDRYNSTTLNGLPLPSNDAELKNIDLEIFATDVIEFVQVEKVFTPNLYGDFAGGNINVVSRKLTGSPFFEVEAKIGSNSSVMKVNNFYLGDGVTVTGFESYNQPKSLNEYNFENNLNPQKFKGYPEGSISFAGGRTFNLGQTKLNLFSTASYNNEFCYSDIFKGKYRGGISETTPDVALNGQKFKYSTQTIGMINLNLEFNSKNNIYINTIFSNTSEQNLQNYWGQIKDIAEAGEGFKRRIEFQRTQIFVNQLLGEHQLAKKTDLNWGIAYNKVNNIIPDRRDNILEGSDDLNKHLSTNDISNNKRYFHDLQEDEIAGNISVDIKIGNESSENGSKGKITLGYSGRVKNRSFISTQFNHYIINNEAINIFDLDSYFNNTRLQSGDFKMRTFGTEFIVPSSYNGEQIINAAFGMLTYSLNKKLSFIIGLRGEQVYQKIDFNTTLNKGMEDFIAFKTLPSFSLKYSANDKTNYRFAYSTTYTLPQFKETAPFLFEGITDETIGNPHLYPSTDHNIELKWEFFPTVGELISVATFGKYIADPINKFVKASATREFTFANTGNWAKIFGAELETRKNIWIGIKKSGEQKISINTNATIMTTIQDLNRQKIIDETEGEISVTFNESEEVLEGAASFIVNAGINYSNSWNENKNTITSSVIYGYVSDYLSALGYMNRGNNYSHSINNLDYVLKYAVKNLGLKLTIKNILDPTFKESQENTNHTYLVDSYSKGIKFNIGLTYKF